MAYQQVKRNTNCTCCLFFHGGRRKVVAGIRNCLVMSIESQKLVVISARSFMSYYWLMYTYELQLSDVAMKLELPRCVGPRYLFFLSCYDDLY